MGVLDLWSRTIACKYHPNKRVLWQMKTAPTVTFFKVWCRNDPLLLLVFAFDIWKLKFYSSHLSIISQRKQTYCLRGIRSINHYLTSCKGKKYQCHPGITWTATSSPQSCSMCASAHFMHCAVFSGHRLCKQQSLRFTLCQNKASYLNIWGSYFSELSIFQAEN